jgi:hypothetical protein
MTSLRDDLAAARLDDTMNPSPAQRVIERRSREVIEPSEVTRHENLPA